MPERNVLVSLWLVDILVIVLHARPEGERTHIFQTCQWKAPIQTKLLAFIEGHRPRYATPAEGTRGRFAENNGSVNYSQEM